MNKRARHKRPRYLPLGPQKFERQPSLEELPIIKLDKKGYVKSISYGPFYRSLESKRSG